MLPLPLGVALLVTALLAGPAGSASHKGGTLYVDLRPDFVEFGDFELSSQGASQITCTKLVEVADGAGPVRIVPDGAAMPAVSRDRKTYTFRINASTRFYPGDQPVTAASFVEAFRREASVFVKGVASVRALSPSKLRIRLTKPAPDFLSRLTMPAFCAVAPGTPRNPTALIPASGPYYVASRTAARVVLKRNSFYKGSKPNNPDEIVFNLGNSLPVQRMRCENGDSDVCGFPPEQAAELAAKYGVNRGRFFVKKHATFWYLALNRDRDLFRDNDKLARAVNYAVDRSAIPTRIGAYAGARTDQIVPPRVPGFRDVKLYPLKAPEFGKARRLARGNLRGGKCQFWTFDSSFGPSVAQVLQADLAQIGLDCDITTLDQANELLMAGTRGAGFDIALVGWNQSYPDPFDYLNALVDGESIKGRKNTNLSYFDDPDVNRVLSAAAGKSGKARRRAYSKLDRDLMRGRAPIVPLFVQQNARTLVSARVGNYVFNQVYGTDWGALTLDQQSAKLTVSVTGAPGRVVSEPAGFSCQTTCSTSLSYGAPATLKAVPSVGSAFVQWTGGCSGTNPRCTVTMNGDRTVQAVFRKS